MTKVLRIALLLLIAVLLPLRGAVAASMACALPAAAGVSWTPAEEPLGHGHHHHGDAPAPHATADKCNLCAAAGSATPVPMQAPPLAQPLLWATLRFATLVVHATGVVPTMPERPPRTA